MTVSYGKTVFMQMNQGLHSQGKVKIRSEFKGIGWLLGQSTHYFVPLFKVEMLPLARGKHYQLPVGWAGEGDSLCL